MDKLTAIRIKYDDGTYSDEIPINVLVNNIEWDNVHTLIDVLGSIAIDTKGSVQDQLNQLFNTKVDVANLSRYVDTQISQDVTTWLDENVNPVGSAVVVDSSLTVSGAAADAKKTGDKFTQLRTDLQSKLLPLGITWISGGYISNNTGEVIAYDSWKYSDYIDISHIENGFFYTKLKTSDTDGGNSYNVMYDKNHNMIGQNFSTGINKLSAIPIFMGAKYIRISCRQTSDVTIYVDQEKVTIPFYKDPVTPTSCCTDYIEIQDIKYVLTSKVPVAIEQFDSAYSSITFFPYQSSKEYYKGNLVKYVRLYIYTNTWTPENVKSISFKPKKRFDKIEYFRLCSFNVGLWNNGIAKQPDATAEEYAQLFRRFVSANDFDLIGCFEAPEKINVSNTVSANSLFYYKLPYTYTFATGNSGVSIKAKDTVLDCKTLSFASGSNRPFYKFKYGVADKDITIYLVHLSIEANSTGIRQQDLRELATILSESERTIIMGDFNTYDMSELNVFSKYNIANGGMFGKFITWPLVRDTWPNGAIDNIITTKDISLQNVYVPDVSLSDHKPIIADLSLYY